MRYVLQVALFIGAITVLALLQHHYWQGNYGSHQYGELRQQIQKQKEMNAQQRLDNQVLSADIQDLKTGLMAVEEHARLDLGLIKPNETFVQTSIAPTVRQADGF